MKALRVVWPLALATLFVMLALKLFAMPFVWSLAAWAVALFSLCRTLETHTLRIAVFNLALFTGLLSAIELGTWSATRRSEDDAVSRSPGGPSARALSELPARSARTVIRNVGTYFESPCRMDDVLGYVPKTNGVLTAACTIGDRAVYDVEYTIDRNLMRVVAPASSPEYCVVFFGGSFMFGHGLPDSATIPYQCGALSRGACRAYNFSFNGYGAHQMLSAIEHGVINTVAESAPDYAVYMAIYGHVARVAGKVGWDSHGPMYAQDENGAARSAGHFDQRPVREQRPFLTRLMWQARKSAILTRLIRWRTSKIDASDEKLFTAVVDAARSGFESEFPGSEFHVIFWDEANRDSKRLCATLRAKGLRVHLASEIIPHLLTNPAEFHIDPMDRHPNRKANGYIARYILARIVRESPGVRSPSLAEEEDGS